MIVYVTLLNFLSEMEIVLSVLHVLIHLNLTMILQSRYYIYFADEETEALGH